MANPFLAEVRLFAFDFPPRGWALCAGTSMPIAQNQALFSLLGTTYGGNGVTTFALPNLQGRMPIHAGAGYSQGNSGGAQTHTLSLSELPAHVHAEGSAAAATTQSPVGTVPAVTASPAYVPNPSPTYATVGGTQPHENMSPYLVVNYSLALQGIYPSQT